MTDLTLFRACRSMLAPMHDPTVKQASAVYDKSPLFTGDDHDNCKVCIQIHHPSINRPLPFKVSLDGNFSRDSDPIFRMSLGSIPQPDELVLLPTFNLFLQFCEPGHHAAFIWASPKSDLYGRSSISVTVGPLSPNTRQRLLRVGPALAEKMHSGALDMSQTAGRDWQAKLTDAFDRYQRAWKYTVDIQCPGSSVGQPRPLRYLKPSME
ncbi:hypothetical protein K458DRAFT_410547 [Lentithecium fluviatile CBS 122367]|uniref:Uncharacterized protein n=1 Tax=Lentithecium fluviatile CBS 122367 TaxID=1168545 RepID=A0A6G1IEK0_9PLEO|nr:hypothetical protein K458DRAFT_410547 [Lentithecium fluviatile CBS 122367]